MRVATRVGIEAFKGGSSDTIHSKDLDTPNVAFVRPELTTSARLDELGVEATGQDLDTDGCILACKVVEPNQWCGPCGCEGAPRDTVTRRLANEPLGWRQTTLHLTCVAFGAPDAGISGVKAPAKQPCHAPRSLVVGCGGRWKGSFASI